jgi:alpha-L-rhamnosidase
VSEYDKLLWFNEYDVSTLLNEGENIISVILGNGFFNENFSTPWNYDTAPWRDQAKFILELFIGDERVLISDENWKCMSQTPIVYNQLRTGEFYDDRINIDGWKNLDFCDKNWQNAVLDENEPCRNFKRCDCEPILEFEKLYPVSVVKNEVGYLVDFGENISGKIYCEINEECGKEIVFQHTEEKTKDNRIELCGLNDCYPQMEFQTDKFISSGRKVVFSPIFTYHGFRYVEVRGAENFKKEDIYAVFIHQAVAQPAKWACSNEVLNFIVKGGVRSVWSNMFYMLTDCPTREKLGWANDAMASLETVFLLFDAKKFFEKWWEDVKAGVRENGEMIAIVPTSGTWDNTWGPVCDGLLFDLPYRLYEYTGKAHYLQEALPYYYRYMDFLENKLQEKFDFILGDWGGQGNIEIPKEFVWHAYRLKFYRRIAFAERVLKNQAKANEIEAKIKNLREQFIQDYITKEGKVAYENVTAVSIAIVDNLCEDINPLKVQLLSIIEKKGYDFCIGMVGAQYVLDALTKVGESEIGVKMLSEGNPGYRRWMDLGATSLWECFTTDWQSHNHHMYSGVIAWFYKTLLGIRVDANTPAFEKFQFTPCFVKNLKFCQGEIQTPFGMIKAAWERKDGVIEYVVEIPNGVQASYQGALLHEGRNTFTVQE